MFARVIQKSYSRMPRNPSWVPPSMPDLPSNVEGNKTFPVLFSSKLLDPYFVDLHRGPTSESNWLIPDLILETAHPYSLDESEGRRRLKEFLESDIRVFVNLQTKVEIGDDEEYPVKYQDQLFRMQDFFPFEFHFIHFEIEDMGVPQHEEVEDLVEMLLGHVENGNRILIHCRGGKGRTGTIAGCLLSEIYPELTLSQVLNRLQVTHDTRRVRRYWHVPQTMDQYKTIEKYIGWKRNDIPYFDHQLIQNFFPEDESGIKGYCPLDVQVTSGFV